HPARRAARRPRAHHRRGADRGARADRARAASCRHPGRAERAQDPGRYRPRRDPRTRQHRPPGFERGLARRSRRAGDVPGRDRRRPAAGEGEALDDTVGRNVPTARGPGAFAPLPPLRKVEAQCSCLCRNRDKEPQNPCARGDAAMTARTKPPFRADHVGSILRSAAIKDARAKHEAGTLTDAQLKEVEDREIDKVIKNQEEIGLKLATDGEYRRSWWPFDFFGMLEGVDIYELDHGIQFQGVQTKPRSIRVEGKIGFGHHPMLDHFKYLKAHAKVTPKMTIPSPTVMHFRLEPGAV